MVLIWIFFISIVRPCFAVSIWGRMTLVRFITEKTFRSNMPRSTSKSICSHRALWDLTHTKSWYNPNQTPQLWRKQSNLFKNELSSLYLPALWIITSSRPNLFRTVSNASLCLENSQRSRGRTAEQIFCKNLHIVL